MKDSIFRHFKGNDYKFIAYAKDSETLEDVVVYQALYDNKEFGNYVFWVRPKKEFFSKVMVDGELIPRFRKIK